MPEPAEQNPVTGQVCFTVCTAGGQRERDSHFQVLDFLDGDIAGIKAVTFEVNGENAYGYLKSEKRCPQAGAYFTV